jgi:hypothetical protein
LCPALLERNCGAWYNIYAASAFGHVSVWGSGVLLLRETTASFHFLKSGKREQKRLKEIVWDN